MKYINLKVNKRRGWADVEIVGQPVSLADRKYLTSQKVLMGSSLLQDVLARWFVHDDHFCQKI